MNIWIKQYCKKFKINKNNYDPMLFLKWYLDEQEKWNNYFLVRSIVYKGKNDKSI
jgi:ferritin